MSETSGRQDAVTPEPIATEIDDIAAAAAIEGSAESKTRAQGEEIEPADQTGADAEAEAPLLADELEHGIASIFAALHAASQDGAEPVENGDEAEVDDNVTFQLLGELDRLWHRAA